MLGIELGVAAAARELLRGRDGLLGLDRQLVEIHRLHPPFREPLLAHGHEVAAVLLVHPLHVMAVLPLQALDLRVRLAQLVLEPQHELDAGEVEAELRGQPLDDLQPHDVRLGVEPRAARRPVRPHEALRLVHRAASAGACRRARPRPRSCRSAGRSGGFSEAPPHPPLLISRPPCSSSRSSRSFLFTRFGTSMRTRASTSPLPLPEASARRGP